MVIAKKAIYFKCEQCGHGQYHDYSLTPAVIIGLRSGVMMERDVNEANIDCCKCWHSNQVIDELKK